MTSWYPGNGEGEDVLTHGDDEPATRPGRLFAAALVLLVLGTALGTRVGDKLPWSAGGTEAHLVGGTLAAASRLDDRHRYRVWLFNPGVDAVRARVVGLDGTFTPVANNPPVRVAAGGWAGAVFSLPRECDGVALPPVSAVRVRLLAPDDTEQRVDLARRGTAPRTNQLRQCTRPTALDDQDLAGLWVVEEAEGRWEDLARIGLMRFTGGRFAFDPEGRLFQEGHQGFFGTYRLHGTRLSLESEGGYACKKGYSEVWTTTRLADDRVQLDIVRSDEDWCHSPPHERQVLRRLVPEDRLPPPERPTSR